MRFSTPTHAQLQEYYGRILSGAKDLKTNTCCCGEEAMPRSIRGILKEIDSEIIERFYGCGSPIPLWRWTAARGWISAAAPDGMCISFPNRSGKTAPSSVST
jgi:hypothetical protein